MSSWIKTTKDLKKTFKPKKVKPIVHSNPCCFPPCRNQPTYERITEMRGKPETVFVCGVGDHNI